METEILVVLVGAGVVVLAWLLLRFGKTIARWALIFGVLVVVGIFGLSLLESNRAARQAATAATVASAGQTTTTVVGGLGVLLLIAIITIAVLLAAHKVRKQLHQIQRRHSTRQTPDYRDGDQPVIVYYVQPDDVVDVDAGEEEELLWPW